MIRSKKQSMIILGAFVIALMLFTTTYAFFNYTRTGTANTIKTGRISFNSQQGTAINLTNMFPIDPTEQGIMDDSTKVGAVTINVTGDTTYGEGLEYLVTATNVTNTVGNKSLPISIDVTVANNSNNDPATTLGTSSGDYYNDRGGDTSYYSVLAGDTINSDDQLLVGYIAPGADGVDGNIVIKAYLDKNKIAISDTYPEQVITHTENEGTEQEEEVVDYTNGTTDTWVDDREVFTTTEWNSLQTNGVSFQVKVESNEGVWVEDLTLAVNVIKKEAILETVSYGKIYTGANPNNYVTFNGESWRIIGVYTDAANGDMLKIVKVTPSTSMPFNYSASNNSWTSSEAKTYLYNTYWENSLNSTAQNMIQQNAIWNIGEAEYNANAVDAYTSAQEITWTGKIGLLASYEFLYAAGSSNSCWEVSGTYDTTNGFNVLCHEQDWIKYSDNLTWTITPESDSSAYVLALSNGSSNIAEKADSHNSFYIVPVVYLKHDVRITGGTGELGGNEYTLSYTAS